MAQRPRQARNDGLRELLIADYEYRLPKSPPPPPWSAPRGWRDELLLALKAGAPVVVSSAELMMALSHAGLPHDRFCYGGADFRKSFVLDEQDRLTELVDDAD